MLLRSHLLLLFLENLDEVVFMAAKKVVKKVVKKAPAKKAVKKVTKKVVKKR